MKKKRKKERKREGNKKEEEKTESGQKKRGREPLPVEGGELFNCGRQTHWTDERNGQFRRCDRHKSPPMRLAPPSSGSLGFFQQRTWIWIGGRCDEPPRPSGFFSFTKKKNRSACAYVNTDNAGTH